MGKIECLPIAYFSLVISAGSFLENEKEVRNNKEYGIKDDYCRQFQGEKKWEESEDAIEET